MEESRKNVTGAKSHRSPQAKNTNQDTKKRYPHPYRRKQNTYRHYRRKISEQPWSATLGFCQNLKTAATSYAAADNLSELQKQIDKKTTEAKSARTELVELEHQMKKVSELLLYAEQYRDNKPFQEKYKKSKDPDRYLRMHETQLILYDGAERMLRKWGLIQNPLTHLKSVLTMRLCRLARQPLKEHINLPKKCKGSSTKNGKC